MASKVYLNILGTAMRKEKLDKVGSDETPAGIPVGFTTGIEKTIEEVRLKTWSSLS